MLFLFKNFKDNFIKMLTFKNKNYILTITTE